MVIYRSAMEVLARTCRLALLATIFAVPSPAFAQTSPHPPLPARDDAAAEFERFAQEDVFRGVADEFMAAAVAGDMTKAARMISPAIAAKTGREGVERYLNGQVLPFFAEFKQIANSVSITRTAEVPGFVFYMYMVSKAGELRPFVIYVIEEGDAKVVANVLVDNFVEGRHCARVAQGWKCPDFS